MVIENNSNSPGGDGNYIVSESQLSGCRCPVVVVKIGFVEKMSKCPQNQGAETMHHHQ